MIPERLADAIDQRRDEQKERALEASHAKRQPIPTLSDVTTPAAIVAVELFGLFDRARSIRGLGITLFENKTPGSVAAFRAWAAANGVAVEVRDVRDMPGAIVVGTTLGSTLDICIHTTKEQP